jgi:hypothetical protein
MERLAAAIASLSWMVSACAQAGETAVTPRANALPRVLTLEDVRMVAPALERYTQGPLLGELWKCHALSPRDRPVERVTPLLLALEDVEQERYRSSRSDGAEKRDDRDGDEAAGWRSATRGRSLPRSFGHFPLSAMR